jgi:hypothetical protein
MALTPGPSPNHGRGEYQALEALLPFWEKGAA